MPASLSIPHSEKIIGIFYDVYNELGYGFLECVYKESMRLALTDAGMFVSVEQPIPVYFKDRKVGEFRADILVDGTGLRLLFDNERKKIRENPCESVAEVLS